MPLDEALLPARLSEWHASEAIARYFPEAYRIRVDVQGVEQEGAGFAGARLPEPLEAVLIDRVLQLVPVELLRGVERIVILPSRGTARYGSYLNGVIRLGVDAASRRIRDSEFGGNYSVFTTTLLHEIGHAVYQRSLSSEQQVQVADRYLDQFIRRQPRSVQEPTPVGGEHFFVTLFSGALLGAQSLWGTAREAREFLESVGVKIDYAGS